MENIAVICARGLGDGLIFMTLSSNLKRSGYKVTTFSDPLYLLKEWFPGHDIQPLCQFSANNFDTLFSADHVSLSQELAHPKLHIFKEDRYDKTKTMPHNLALFCQQKLKLPFHEISTGITPPKELRQEKAEKPPSRKIVLHPTSTDPLRTWHAQKFIRLADALKRKGWDPVFCVSAAEYPSWIEEVNRSKFIFSTPYLSSLTESASLIYLAQGFIGNNSGPGHLASALGLPSLSLFARMSYAALWRPGFATNQVVTPLPLLVGAPLKQRYWQHALPVRSVLSAFQKLMAPYG